MDQKRSPGRKKYWSLYSIFTKTYKDKVQNLAFRDESNFFLQVCNGSLDAKIEPMFHSRFFIILICRRKKAGDW